MFDQLGSLANTFSPVTNLVPGGPLVNSAIGLGSKLGNWLTGKGGVPDHERGDIVSISNRTGLTQDQVSWLCGMEEQRSSDNYDAIVKKYAANPDGLLPLVDEWNRKNPSKKIVTLDSITPNYPQTAPVVPPMVYQAPTAQQLVPVSVVQTPLVLPALAPPTAPQAQNLTGGDIKDAGGAIIKGAQAGLSNWFMTTPAGMQAKNDGAISWVKDNVLFFCLGALALGALIFKAFSKK